MGYLAELDDTRQELRYGDSGAVLRFWPKHEGANVAITSATYSIYAPHETYTGTALASGTATNTSIDSVSRLDISLNLSSTASYPLAENYRAEISWIYSAKTYLATVYFDVARAPYKCDVSLNDLLDEVSDIEERLERQALAIVSGRTAAQHAGVLAVKAWGDVREQLRQRCERDGRIMPRLIADRESLRRVVVARTLARVYRSEGATDSDSAEAAREWERIASERFDGMGPLRYDAADDGTVDTEFTGFSTVRTRRSW